MLNFLNLSPIKNLNPVNFRGNSHSINYIQNNDSFELSEFEKAKISARKLILENMNSDGNEYSVTISKDGRILDTNKGTSDSVNFDRSKLENNCTVIHGHPEKVPLSPPDIKTLLVNSEIDSIEAIAPDGSISRMSKTSNTAKYEDENKVLNDLYDIACKIFLEKAGINCDETEDDIVELVTEYAAKTGIDIKNKDKKGLLNIAKAMGCFDENDIKSSYKNLSNVLFMVTNDIKYCASDKAKRLFFENKDIVFQMLSSPNELELQEMVLRAIASIYNLKYETTMS